MYAGTTNQQGALIIAATGVGEDSSAAHLTRMVSEAQGTQVLLREACEEPRGLETAPVESRLLHEGRRRHAPSTLVLR